MTVVDLWSLFIPLAALRALNFQCAQRDALSGLLLEGTMPYGQSPN